VKKPKKHCINLSRSREI